MNVRFYFGSSKKAIATYLKLGSDVQGHYVASDADPRDPTFILREELRENISFVSCLVHHSIVSKWRLPDGVSFCNIPGVVIIHDAHRIPNSEAIVKAPTWEALCSVFEQLENPELVYTMPRSKYLLERALEKQIAAEKVIKWLQIDCSWMSHRIESDTSRALLTEKEIGRLKAEVHQLKQDLAIANKRPWRRSANFAKSIWNRMCVE
ncbi:MAG: hypothetical protein AAB552_00540 [Patescibacteria group bacterium]